jgi:hypothetical protein
MAFLREKNYAKKYIFWIFSAFIQTKPINRHHIIRQLFKGLLVTNLYLKI